VVSGASEFEAVIAPLVRFPSEGVEGHVGPLAGKKSDRAVGHG
jgi:hypothetical protein